MRRILSIAATVATIALLGCHRPPAKEGVLIQMKKPTAYYYEFLKDGQYYVFASNAKATEFMRKGEPPCMKALISAGPEGKTFFVEADKGDNPEPARRLAQKFRQYHPDCAKR